MNKTYITLAATTALALALNSCQKGDLLNVVQDDVELNENTAQYQDFIKERVTDYARAYRFEQARANLPKLTDEANRKEGERIINFYHAKALKDGFAYLLPNGDSLFLKMKNEENLPPEKIEHILQFNQYAEFKGLGQDVTLWGAANFPNTKSIYIDEAQITKMLDLDKLTKLEEVRLIFEAGNFDYTLWFPNRPFKPIDVSGYDFSKNDKITWMEFKNCNLTAPKVPANVLPTVNAQYCLFNSSTINSFKARSIKLDGSKSQEPNIKVKNPYLRRLHVSNSEGLKEGTDILSFDVSESDLTYLSIYQGGKKAIPTKEIKLNSKLDSLFLYGSTQEYAPKQGNVKLVGLEKLSGLKLLSFNPEYIWLLPQEIPCPVTSLTIAGSGDVDIKEGTLVDYSKVKGLKVLRNEKYITATTKYPTQLDTLQLAPFRYAGKLEQLDLSHLNVKTISLELGNVYRVGISDFGDKKNTLYLKRVVLPATITSAKLEDMATEVLDLSKLDNVSKLEIDDIYQEERSVKEIIFPKNLKRSNFKNNNDFLIRVDKGKTKLVNYPSWVTQDEFGNDVAK